MLSIYKTLIILDIWFVAGEDKLQLLRNACPYSDFCTVNRTDTVTKTDDVMPCCYECYCDEYCVTLGDCCPDADQNKSDFYKGEPACTPVGRKSDNDDKATYFNLPNYRVIRFCPDGYTGSLEVVGRCEGSHIGNPELEDLVLVSDRNGRIFQNKHCAACHGAEDTTRWNMMLRSCVDDFDILHMTLHEARDYILENCTLVIERPSQVPLTSRTLECGEEFTCIDGVASERDHCLNGPYMPYIEIQPYSPTGFILHKNAICAQCSGYSIESPQCPNVEEWITRSSVISFILFLNPDMAIQEDTRPKQHGCDEGEMMDLNTGSCRRLYCRPFEVVTNGTCVPLTLGTSSYLVEANIIFTLKDPSEDLILDKMEYYNTSVENYYVKRATLRYGIPSCDISKVTVVVQTEKQQRYKFERLILQIFYQSNENCSLRHIGESVNRKKRAIEEMWLLQDKRVRMIGQFTFFSGLYQDNRFFTDVLMYVTKVGNRVTPLGAFYICPYFTLSVEEYKKHIEKKGESGYVDGLRYFTPSMRYPRGFYPLSSTEVAACVDDYMPGDKNSQPQNEPDNVLVLIGLLILSVVQFRFYV